MAGFNEPLALAELLKLAPRALDTRIAKLLGWRYRGSEDLADDACWDMGCGAYCGWAGLPKFSQSLSEAFRAWTRLAPDVGPDIVTGAEHGSAYAIVGPLYSDTKTKVTLAVPWNALQSEWDATIARALSVAILLHIAKKTHASLKTSNSTLLTQF